MGRGSKPPKSGTVAALLCLVGVLGASLARAETRVVVWASDYRTASDPNLVLPNTLVDARAVTDLFRKLKVQDLTFVENPTAEAWNAAIDGLVARLGADDVAVLYYAGHAVQVNGQNFFLAGDGTTLIASEQVLAPIMARAKGTVFLVDACRDNPFKESAAPRPGAAVKIASGSRAVETLSLDQLSRAQGGLSQMSNLRGRNTIVLFSTDPGNVALDGPPGKGSPFANAVVRELGRRQSLDAAIRRITEDVDKASSGRQAPWRQGDLTFPLFLGGQPRFPVP